MPRDSAGNYSLPDGYLAVAGETIQPSQHNPPLEDIAQALTGSLPRNGSAPMGAPLKLADGTAAQPSLTFNSATGTGFYLISPTVIGLAIGGLLVNQFSASGVGGAVPIGAGMDYWGTNPPTGWLFANGGAVSRTTYAALFAVFGTTYGIGDGSTTFNLPDKRGRASFARDDMGGFAAGRITNQPGGWNAIFLGAAGGSQTHTLSVAELASHGHTGSADSASPNTPTYTAYQSNVGVQAGASDTVPRTASAVELGVNGSLFHNHSLTINNAGGGGAHNNLPPGITCNYIIYAGV